jgi:hypothetical protein
METFTFRDFAGAIMGSDAPRASHVLGVLLNLDAEAASAAVAHFQASMTADPAFMQKAMGLRAAVTGGTDAEITARLGDCFGLRGPAVTTALAALRVQYPGEMSGRN